jgi:excisionase family DNA binding protein
MPIQLGTLTLFEVSEICKKFGFHPITVRKILARGKLRGQKIGRKWYVSEDAFRDYFNEPRRTPEPPAKAAKG